MIRGPSRDATKEHVLTQSRRRSSSRRPGRTRVGRATSATWPGFAVPADVFARYHRLKGNDVLMVSGTDEHGTPVMVSADRSGVSPRELADRNNELIRDDLRDLGISYDCFTRTTTRNHTRVTQDIFRTLYDKGYLVEQTTLGAFSPDGRTLPDRYIEGTCPICGFPEARGDQCDNCGNQLDPVDLIDPRSIIDGSTPEFRETTAPVPRPAGVRRAARGVARRAGRTGGRTCKNFSLGLVQRAEAARDDARHRLGRARAGRRAIRRTRSGSTSGSTP